MRIRPYIITGGAAAAAGAALSVLVLTHDPFVAEPAVRVLFWIALPLAAWMLVATVLVVCRIPLTYALWCTFPAVGAIVALLAYDRHHGVPVWLRLTVLLATLGLTELLRRLVSSHQAHG